MSACDICGEKPAPHPHLGDPTKRLCAACRELQEYAVDLAAKAGAGRVGDVGERRAVRAGHQVKGGRGGAG
jgi:hypothetical protein